MGLLDTLNGVTNKLNEFADKVSGGQQNAQNPGQTANCAGGLSGLGIINTDNANGGLQSPSDLEVKVDADSRLLATNMTRFSSTEQYKQYLISYFNSSGIGTASEFSAISLGLTINQTINGVALTSNYVIFPTLNYNEVMQILQNLQQPQDQSQTKNVIIGYFNYGSEQVQLSKQLGIELVGANEILEINNAISSGLKGMPYIAFDKKSFTHLVSSMLNTIYSTNKSQNGIVGTFEQVTKNVGDSLQNFGNNVSNTANNTVIGAGTAGVVAAAVQENNVEPQVLSETDDGKVILKKEDEQAKVSLEKDNEPVKVSLEKKEEA